MTREEAINRLRDMIIEMRTYCDESKHISETDRQDMEIFDMAIKALENQTSVIDELKKIKEEIKDLDLGFVDEDYRAGVARGTMEFNKILNNRIAELKGDNNG